MASSKVMPSAPNSTNSDLNSHHTLLHHHNPRHQFHRNSPMISDFDDSDDRINAGVDGILRDVYSDVPPAEEISLIDAAGAISAIEETTADMRSERRTAEEVWREIVEGRSERKECKVEAVDEMMTLEDFLAKEGVEVEVEVAATATAEEEEMVEDVKVDVSGEMQQLFGFDHGLVQSSYPSQPQPSMAAMGGVMVYGNGNGGGMEGLGGGVRGKRRGGPILEPLDKAAQQRQRRMIKNRESAARSRERKQAYQVELELLAMKLEEENQQLLREKAERKNERFKQLMEKVVPVVEKRRPPRVLRRVRSMQW